MRSRILVVALAAALALPLNAIAAPDPAVDRGLAFLRGLQGSDGCIADAATSGWSAVAFAAAGVPPESVRAGGASLEDCLRALDAQVFQPGAPLTSLERQILAIVAAGEDPRTFEGRDHVAALLAAFDGTQFGHPFLLNDDYFGVLALAAAGYDGPVLAQARAWILLNQHASGGWSWTLPDPGNAFSALGILADTDDTAAALAALALTDPAGGEPASAQAQLRGLGFVRGFQNVDGGCSGGLPDLVFQAVFEQSADSNVYSTAWAAMGVRAAGQDPAGALWTQPTGTHLLGWLRATQLPSGAWASFVPEDPQGTAFAVMALAGATFGA